MNAIQYDETPAENSVSPLNPSTGERQELILKDARDESADWNMSPAELYTLSAVRLVFTTTRANERSRQIQRYYLAVSRFFLTIQFNCTWFICISVASA